MEADPAGDRADDLRRLPRAIAWRAAVRLDRGTLRPHESHGRLDRAIRRDESCLRVRLGLRVVAGVAHHPRDWTWRGGAGRRRLHQRARKGAGPWPLRAFVRTRSEEHTSELQSPY